MSTRAVTDVVQQAIASAVERLLENEAGVRAANDDEAVHQARVATRRLRSDLRTFEFVLDDAAVRDLRGELRWLGSELGVVRDLDVLRARLREHATKLPAAESEAAQRVVRRLDADRHAAGTELHSYLEQSRYRQLRDALRDAAAQPPFRSDATKAGVDELHNAVDRRWKKLRRGVEDLGDTPADDALHHVRVLAKRARYAAEASVPMFGKPAKKLAAAVEAIQESLGEHHDAVVAQAWLAKTAHECTPAEAYAVGMLAQVEREAADDARGAFEDAWRAARKTHKRVWT
jgi:CHAD domain-containing protein